ncbi:YfaZ family outer membrane protein [Reinekea sp. G2M2-21]|uniref:YfaZ family outer membrane protein n=1 Tax=Reinekea sp. G2M2-21 TaxID=2788942 RepID=UPI0018AB7C01|nr:YfaZ family outer membrane protein [Reinekea sp. G2M2-21]
MNIKKAIVAAVAASVAGGSFAGGAVDFSLSNTSVRLEHDAVLVGTGAHFSTGVLYSEETGNWSLSVGFNAVDATMANKELIGGVGFKGQMLSTEVSDFDVALGVGGFLRWQPDFMNGLGVEGQAYIAPSILSFGDLTEVYDGVARISYKVLPQARAFVGYHIVRGTYVADAYDDVDSTFHLGFRITY